MKKNIFNFERIKFYIFLIITSPLVIYFFNLLIKDFQVNPTINEELLHQSIFITFSLSLVLLYFRFPFFSFEIIFLYLFFIFYFSRLYLYSINYSFPSHEINSDSITNYGDNYYRAVIFSLISLFFLVSGFIFYKVFFSNKNKVSKFSKSSKNLFNDIFIVDDIRKVQFFINFSVMVGSPFYFYILIRRLIIIFAEGYTGIHDFQYGIFVSIFSNLFIFGLLLNYFKKPSNNLAFIFVLILSSLSLLTGLRAYSVLTILLVTLFHISTNFKKNYILLFLLVFLSPLFLNLLFFIRDNRNLGFYDLNELLSALFSFESLLVEISKEFGFSINVLSANITLIFTGQKDFSYGGSFISSIIFAIPFHSRIFGNAFIYRYYPLYYFNQQSIGSSFVSDLFIDFGYYSVIFVFAFGVFFSLVIDKFQKNYKMRPILGTFLFMILIELFYLVRSYLFRIPRYTFYLFIAIFFVYIFYKLLGLFYGKYSKKII